MQEKLTSIRRPLKYLLKAGALVQSGMILEYLSEEFLARGAYPEPFDVASHIGNFKEGSLLTSGFGAMIGIALCMPAAAEENAEKFRRRAKITAGTAFVLSAAVQYFGEKYGLNNVVVNRGQNTPDMLDAAYGTLWSGVTAFGGYSLVVDMEKTYRNDREQTHAGLMRAAQQSTEA